MVSEAYFEKDVVLDYIVNQLKYERLDSNLFNSELLMVPQMVENYIWTHYSKACEALVRNEYSGDKKEFIKEFCQELYKFVFDRFNVAIALNPNKYSFEFKNFKFQMYKTFNLPENDTNLYGVMNQIVFKFNGSQGKYSIKPDVGIFINGILFSYIELKLNHTNQTAKVHGRGKIINDYIESIEYCVTDFVRKDPEAYPEEKDRCVLKKKALNPFHKMTHILAMDNQETYIMRGLERFYPLLEKKLRENNNVGEITKREIIETFYLDSIFAKNKYCPSFEKTQNCLNSLYNKERIQDEICYLNFVAYEKIAKTNNGKKTVSNKNNNPFLIFPRPNQKFALNKVIEDVISKYENEKNPNYQLDKLRAKLEAGDIPEDMILKELEKRALYTNTQKQYSMLLQYSAGFGKTYIICWLGLMLKDLLSLENKKDYLFDKILLVSDRVDLRDQTFLAMNNMNIDRSLFCEAENKQELKKALTDNGTRIIVVNIQKFPFVSEVLGNKEQNMLKGKRIAFLIDEVHRSNSGEQNKTMINIFDEITSSGSGETYKKNLVIGLTATPSDEILAKYGEYQGCTDILKWVPFDCYTMNEAIKDGFVLNPLMGFVNYSVQLEYEEDKNKIVPRKETIYENSERIEVLSKFIVDKILNVTYTRIRGTGKAMLACYSIKAAKEYFYTIKKLLEEQPENSRFKDSRVYIVYSPTQLDKPANEICSDDKVSYPTEKDVINAFKTDKNGIMIVVDKLQTGFDEPKLHTLFLDKEVSGINAVQTLCRVNRTTKHKKDCLVVDLSHNNANNIPVRQAFEKYENMTVSDFDTYGIKKVIEDEYRKIVMSDPYDKFFKRFKVNPDNMELAAEMSDYVSQMLNEALTKISLKDIINSMMSFVRNVMTIADFVDLDKKYTDITLSKFIKVFVNLLKTTSEIIADEDKEEAEFVVLDSGEIIIPPTEYEKEETQKKETQGSNNTDPDGYESISKLEELNLLELEKAEFIKSYRDNLQLLFEAIKAKDDGSLKIKALNINKYSNEEREIDFIKCFKAVKRRKSDLSDFIAKVDTPAMLTYIEKDFYNYIFKNGWK